MNIDQMSLVTAILDEISRQAKPDKTGLLARQFNAVIKAADIVVAEMTRGYLPSTPKTGLKQWLASDDTGASSLYMAFSLFSEEIPTSSYAHPHDPSDFLRCLKLYEAEPRCEALLGNMASLSLGWKEIASNWKSWQKLVKGSEDDQKKLYEKMKAAGL